MTEFVSLDGVIEDPGGGEEFRHGGWSFEFDRGDEGDRFKLDEALSAEALLLGRTAVSLLIRLLERQRFETLHLELATRLVVRDSTAPPRSV